MIVEPFVIYMLGSKSNEYIVQGLKPVGVASHQSLVNQLVSHFYSPEAVNFVYQQVKGTSKHFSCVIFLALTLVVFSVSTFTATAHRKRVKVTLASLYFHRFKFAVFAHCEIVLVASPFFFPLVSILHVVYKAPQSRSELCG